jgi:anaerobic nitric oxide reductase transcription regulator
VGSDETIFVNVRLLVATNRDLEKEVKAARFRADLFHRLNVYPINVPPLRERKEDIPLLVGYFCELTQRKLGTGPVRIGTDTMNVLSKYQWPGNIRELENIISRAILQASKEHPKGEIVVIEPTHFGGDISAENTSIQQPISEIASASMGRLPFREAVEEFQRDLITRAVAKTNGNWSAAARDLSMHRSNLHKLATRLGLRQKKSRF